MKIVVLAGGLSPERDVSLLSGTLITKALKNKGHDVTFLDLLTGEHISTDKSVVDEKEPNLKFLKEKYKCDIGNGVIELCKEADIVFLALHGGIGENGKLQAIFDAYNINYTGSSSLGSMLAMNKDLAKLLVRNDGVLTADWKLVSSKEEIDFDFPFVIKPNDGGSSIGVFIIQNEKDLENVLIESEMLVEKLISGREFSVGILNNEALPPIEIIPKEGFYDYKNKYQAGRTIEVCPASISSDLEKGLKDMALKAHKVLKLDFYSRIDFIVDKDNNIYFLEANTLPGMTPTSLLPQEAKAIGIEYEDLCEKIALREGL